MTGASAVPESPVVLEPRTPLVSAVLRMREAQAATRLSQHINTCRVHEWEPMQWQQIPARIKRADPWTVVRLGPDADFAGKEWTDAKTGEVLGRCHRAVAIQLEASLANVMTKPPAERTRETTAELRNTARQRLHSHLWVRCRNCRACQVAFACHWTYRGLAEAAEAKWVRFSTLTFAVAATTTQEVYDAVRHYLVRVREACPGVGFSELWVIERGKRGTQRLHVHMVIFGFGPNIPKRVWDQRRGPQAREPNPRGLWFEGYVKTRLVHKDKHKAALSYLLKYTLKENGAERLPGGRRIGVSHHFGNRGATQRHGALVGTVRDRDDDPGPAMSVITDPSFTLIGRPVVTPVAGERPNPALTAGARVAAFNCALLFQSPASPLTKSTARAPPELLEAWLKAIRDAFPASDEYPLAVRFTEQGSEADLPSATPGNTDRSQPRRLSKREYLASFLTKLKPEDS